MYHRSIVTKGPRARKARSARSGCRFGGARVRGVAGWRNSGGCYGVLGFGECSVVGDGGCDGSGRRYSSPCAVYGRMKVLFTWKNVVDVTLGVLDKSRDQLVCLPSGICGTPIKQPQICVKIYCPHFDVMLGHRYAGQLATKTFHATSRRNQR